MNIAVIPARAGSKRIANKNIRRFLGRPILAYTIDAARESNCFDRIVVSTDSEQIAACANDLGAETPFLRPASLSDDHTGTAEVLKHALETLNAHAEDIACLLHATAPFLRPEDLQEGLKTFLVSSASSAVSVTTFPFPVQRAMSSTPSGRMAMLWPEHQYTRSQDLPETYHDAGQFYFTRTGRFCERPDFYADAIPLVLPRNRVQDIDTEEDWICAEQKFRLLHGEIP